MTKSKLAEQMADKAGISKTVAHAALNSLLDNAMKALKKKDGKVVLKGFGVFRKVRRKARKYRHPQTGRMIRSKASNGVKFKPGKKLKDAMNDV